MYYKCKITYLMCWISYNTLDILKTISILLIMIHQPSIWSTYHASTCLSNLDLYWLYIKPLCLYINLLSQMTSRPNLTIHRIYPSQTYFDYIFQTINTSTFDLLDHQGNFSSQTTLTSPTKNISPQQVIPCVLYKKNIKKTLNKRRGLIDEQA